MDNLHCLLMGRPGAGKSTLAATLPKPMLVIMTDPPGKQTLLRNLKKIEEKEAAAAKAQQEAAAKKEGLRVAK